MAIEDMLKKINDGVVLDRSELIQLLNLHPTHPDSYRIMAAARHLAENDSQKQAEIHGQLCLNLMACPLDCLFCSFATVNDVFHDEQQIRVEEAVSQAKAFQKAGVNAVFIMCTGNFDFGTYIEYGQEIRRHLSPDMPLIANVGDRTLGEAKQLRDAGFNGVYHAMRLREGKDTRIEPEARIESIRNFKEADLSIGTCVEPVGPEHTSEELADAIIFSGSFDAAYSGAARRIAIPGGVMEQLGMITELRMAQIVAITRLGVPHTVVGNCTHEPCTVGALAGANLFWAEVGANPRDTQQRTEEGRGHNVSYCRSLFEETEWDIRTGPSLYYSK